ncbi:hypothetical protein MBRA1_003855 [Malassezia brasiliensis]|uniref:Uncharacterized protein n=1 Tax=Malassezia brasiliensis TaxID=1821822 RepID=A0AAF0DXI1_9BASI|nr:hypothetical protein MBRA1_003855 [Malassezia brasiliensis]
MGGHNLEVFRFGFYLAFPLAFMVYFGDPAWYDKYVLPFRDRFVPPETGFRHPRSVEELRELRSQKAGDPAAVTHQPVSDELRAWRAADRARII